MYIKTDKKAFSLLELIFVIVILGIVSSIGSSIIAQIYENYIVQRAMHRVSLKTELAATQIANRLAYRINSSVITRDVANSITPLEDVTFGASDLNAETLEWIGYDNDSFSARARPGWSGYCDTNTTTSAITNPGRNRIHTPGSRLRFTNAVIRNLSSNTKTIADTALFFSTNGIFFDDGNPGGRIRQRPQCYGFEENNATCVHRISGRIGNRTLQTDDNMLSGTQISQHYKLAWSAYALVPVNVQSTRLFDLALRYNYQPWDRTYHYSNGTSQSILIRNVSSFKFSEQGGTVRFKLCATEQIGDANTTNISVCKEKVVIR